MFVELLKAEQVSLNQKASSVHCAHVGAFVHAEDANEQRSPATRYDNGRTPHRRAFCLLHSCNLTSTLDLALIEHVDKVGLVFALEVLLECEQ